MFTLQFKSGYNENDLALTSLRIPLSDINGTGSQLHHKEATHHECSLQFYSFSDELLGTLITVLQHTGISISKSMAFSELYLLKVVII